MVNLSYRNSSAIHKAAELVRQGAIGRVIHFEASYLQSWLVQSAWGDWRTKPAFLWRLSTRHGNKGTLGDIGVHIVDFAGYPLGEFLSIACKLKTFPKARKDRVGEYVMDANDSVVITAEMKDGAIGTIHTTRWASGHHNSLSLKIFGDKGGIRVDLDKAYDRLEICRGAADLKKARWKTVRCGKVPNLMQRFARSIRTGINEQPDFARGAAVQRVLDACFESDKKGKPVKIKRGYPLDASTPYRLGWFPTSRR
jgi:predicted dehydrogenase